MSKFFISRPIFAWVIALLIMLVGIISVNKLPIEQYPQIAPTTVRIQATYPGADAQTIENSVTQVIEQQMKGLDGLMYMTSNSSSSGSGNVVLTFENGTNPDAAQVQVQNKLQSATSGLPEAVQRQGLTVSKSTSSFLMVTSVISEDGTMSEADIADYVSTNLVDPISRVEGVGAVNAFGAPYAMRIWLDPAKLRAYNLMPSDVASAIRSQNVQVSAGQLGDLPSDESRQVINASVSVQSYLQTPEQFGNILLKTDSSGAKVRLSDVAKVEIGSQNYAFTARFSSADYDGKPASGFAVMLASGANALETRKAVGERLDSLQKTLPKGLKMVVAQDSTPFVRLSIIQVVKTLAEAIILVFLVMFLFLQNWRATLIPTLAVPVVILGTFSVLLFFGYSINILTMFAMVLAIGLLVDDAIVVVENVERILEENPKMSAFDATVQSMGEISRVIVAIALILSVVFVPMVFFGGSVGVIYRQFAITLIASMVLSAVVALIFTPALCATILKHKDHKDIHTQKGFFGAFNRLFDRASRCYEGFVGKAFKARWLFFAAYLGVIAILGAMFVRLPTSFVPEEDQGTIMTVLRMPSGTPLSQTNEAMAKITDYYRTQEGNTVASVFAITGFSFMGNGQNAGMAFIKLKDWNDRKGKQNTAQAIAERAKALNGILKEAEFVFVSAPPAIQGFGSSNGFDLHLQDVGGVGREALMEARSQLMAMAMQNPNIASVRPGGANASAKLKLDVNHEQAAAYGLNLSDVNSTLAMAWGGSYVNDFIDRGRIKKVYMQGDASSRVVPEDINKWFVRNKDGQMIGFDAFSQSKWEFGSTGLDRYNGFASAPLSGQGAMSVSTGEAMAEMEKLIGELPEGIGYEWSGLSFQEKESGNQAYVLYAVSILVVFLCLAALYESWSVPFAVLLVVPMGVVGTVALTAFKGLANDVYLQVGLLTVVGLSAKNAILIIEFAKELQEKDKPLKEAIMMASKMRLRPIIMTSLAFGVGVLPLYLATGAGSGSQNAVGTGVLGGVISATVLGVFFIPMFYVWVRSVFPYKEKNSHKPVNLEKPL